MTIINLTPHTINIHDDIGNITTVKPSGIVARVTSTSEIVGRIENIPIRKTTFGKIENLPEPNGNTFVASMLVASRAVALGRTDVCSPGNLIRDDSGKPIGCNGLSLPA